MLPPLFSADYLSRLETLRIQTRRRFLGSRPGGHVSLRRGAGLEFAEYRRYSPGADQRKVPGTNALRFYGITAAIP